MSLARAIGLVAIWWPASAQWVASVYLGASHTQPAALTISQPALNTAVQFNNIAFAARSFSPPVYYGYAVAHFWRERFGVEGELIHLKVYGQMQRPATVEGTLQGALVSGRVAPVNMVSQFDITHGVNPIVANFVLRQGFGQGRDGRRRAYLLVRAGAGITVPHHENTVSGVHSEYYQLGRPVIQTGAGGELRLWRGLYGAAQYKFTWTRQRVDVAEGTARVALRSHHAGFGFAWHF
jgi:hypothetical protein